VKLLAILLVGFICVGARSAEPFKLRGYHVAFVP
jgi:hypothetical protein